MTKPFNAFEAAVLKALAQALFHGVEMAIPPAQVVDNLQRQFAPVPGKAREIGLSLLAVFVVLGGPLFLVTPDAWKARRVARRLQRATNDLIQDLGRLRGVIHAGYYGHWLDGDEDANRHNPVHAQIGFTLPKHRDQTVREVPIALATGRDLADSDFLAVPPAEVDVIVIGSGAGGAVAAANLAKHYGVLVIEAGSAWPSHRITVEERRMTANLFRDSGLQTSIDNDMVVFQGRCVGGSTTINNGICLRVKAAGETHPDAEDVLATWAALGAPVDEARFMAAYEAVEHRLGIGPIAPYSGRNNGPHLLTGWERLKAARGEPLDLAATHGWFRKNWGEVGGPAECASCGYCNTGCPYGRKTAMPQSYLRDVVAAGSHILPDTEVLRIRWKPGHPAARIADGVEVRLADGRRQFIRARRGVVVAAGTLQSSRLLIDSGVRGAGTGISLNIACPVAALMPRDMRVWDEDQMATFVDRGDFLLESHFQPPMSMSTLMPGWGAEHHRRMRNYNRAASAGVLIPADRRGRLNGGKLHIKLREGQELPLLRRALATLARVHAEAGAEEIWPALARGPTLRPDTDFDAYFAEHLREQDDVTLSSSHPHGGNARNADPDAGVVDLDCRLHGAANVLVTDASVFTSCIRVNAQLTTMAMAHYATEGRPFG